MDFNSNKRPRITEPDDQTQCVKFDPQTVTGLYITSLPGERQFHLVSVELDHDAYGEQYYHVSVNITPSGDISDMPGSDRDSCMSVDVIIDCDDDRTATIEQIQYNKLCAFGGMSRRSGTVSMVKSTMLLCKRLFNIDSYTLLDHSTYLCESTGETTSLRDHNLFVYGKSWYERNFGATVRSNSVTWTTFQQRLQQHVNKEEVSKLTRALRRIDHPYSQLIEETFKNFTGQPWNHAFEDMHLRHECVIFTESFLDILIRHFDILPVDQWEISVNDQDKLNMRRIFSGDIEFEF